MVELIDNMTFRGQQAPIQSWNYLNLRDLTSMTTNWICVRIYRYRYIKMQACTHVRVHVCVYVCVCPFPSQESFPNWATTQVFHFLLHNPSLDQIRSPVHSVPKVLTGQFASFSSLLTRALLLVPPSKIPTLSFLASSWASLHPRCSCAGPGHHVSQLDQSNHLLTALSTCTLVFCDSSEMPFQNSHLTTSVS